jgi:hypothetical protein
MSKCLFELYKLNLAAQERRVELKQKERLSRLKAANTDAVISARQAVEQAKQKLAEQQLDEQRFQGAMQLLQQSHRMLSPTPRRSTTCQFNSIMNTMVCR